MQIDRPIVSALILFIILLLVFFLVVPEYKTFGKLRTEFSEKRAEYNAEFDYYAAIAKAHSDLQSRQDDIKKIDDALPHDSDIGNLIYFFQEIAKENGMIFKDLFLSKTSSSKTSSSAPRSNSAQSGLNNKVKDMVFSIDLIGSYPSLGSFIISLEKSSRLFEITNISFGSTNSQLSQLSQPSQPSQPLQPQLQTQQIYNFSLQIKTHSY